MSKNKKKIVLEVPIQISIQRVVSLLKKGCYGYSNVIPSLLLSDLKSNGRIVLSNNAGIITYGKDDNGTVYMWEPASPRTSEQPLNSVDDIEVAQKTANPPTAEGGIDWPEEHKEAKDIEDAEGEEIAEPPRKVARKLAVAERQISERVVMNLIGVHGVVGDSRSAARIIQSLDSNRISRIVLKDGEGVITTKRSPRRYFITAVTDKLEAVEVIPTGEHSGTEDDKVKLFRSPAGTEAIVFQQMETMLAHGIRLDNSYDEDDDDDEDDSVIRNAARSIVITPSIYFQFVKSKFTEVQKFDLELKLKKLATLLTSTKQLRQTALYEDLAIQIAGMSKEFEASTIGCGRYISKSIINHFIHHVEDRVITFCEFDKFPRVVPAVPAAEIKRVMDFNVFDKYQILYADYTHERLTTNQDKIRDKDPIIFGVFDHQPNTLYYITDWVDEYCDLTLDKLIDTIKLDDAEFVMGEVPEVTQEFIDSVVADVEKRHLRLKKTNSRNYRQLIREEAEEAEERANQLQAQLAEIKAEDANPTDAEPVSWFDKLVAKAKQLVS